MTDRARYMLDANAFDFIVDRDIDPRAVRGLGDICITNVQHGELLDVPDPHRRRRLLRALSAIDPTIRPAADPSDAARRLRARARRAEKWKDVTIGEAAEREGCTLVTDDKRFRQRLAELGVPVLSCHEAFAELIPH